MTIVGIRQLKSKLSAYIRLARAGEVVLITDRGEIVAQLGLPSGVSVPIASPGLGRLIRDGIVRPAIQEPPAERYGFGQRPPLTPGLALRMLDDLRAER